jgi:hypothetical protein
MRLKIFSMVIYLGVAGGCGPALESSGTSSAAVLTPSIFVGTRSAPGGLALPVATTATPTLTQPAQPQAPPSYHGGPLLTQPIDIYIIWYGNWPDTAGGNALKRPEFPGGSRC